MDKNAIEISNLNKIYQNGFEAIKNISFNVKEGDFFALLGPNGAGKSTTIGIIVSLVKKTGGNISVFDTDIDENLELAKSYIGVVPQEINFNMWEPVEEILINQAGFYGIPRNIAIKRSEKYLKKLGLWEKRKDVSRMLSGGMKRRLMIARALMHEPKLLILDEPTAGVDIEIRRSMWDFLIDLNKKGLTIILTTHYLEEAENLCKNIAIINHGQIIENTSMKKLLEKLNIETFILDTKEPINKNFKLKNYPTKIIDDNTIEVQVSKQNSINELFLDLSSNKIEVLSMRNKTNRLEEFFINLVENNNNHNNKK